MSAGFGVGGDWAIRFSGKHEQIKCYVVMSGECWLAVGRIETAMHLEEGDCFVMPSARLFRMASDLELPAVSASTILTAARPGEIIAVAGGKRLKLDTSKNPLILLF